MKGTLNSTIDTYGLEDRYYQAVCEGFFRMFYKNTQANYSYSRLRNFYIKLYNKFVVKRIPEERIEEYNDKCFTRLTSQLESQCSIEERYRDEVDRLDDPDSPDYGYKIIEEREDSPKGL